jgi:hypothetical protein
MSGFRSFFENTEVIRTKKGTPIGRYKGNVGKMVGPQLYIHKNYAEEVIPADLWNNAKAVLAKEHPDHTYNAVMYDKKKQIVRFDEAPDFDTAREPMVGMYVAVLPDGTTKKPNKPSEMIWHHKWLWVRDEDYDGFNTGESKEWSRTWASKLDGIAKGNQAGFSQQLRDVGLS